MSHEPPLADKAAVSNQPSSDVAEDLVVLRRILRHLAEIGDEFAEMVREESRQIALCQAESAKRYPDPALVPHPALPPDLVDAYDRITRSVRRSIMLYLKVIAPQKTAAADRRIVARKRIIRDVEDAIHLKAPPGEKDKLRAELLERLDSPYLEHDIANQPIPEIVTDLCRDFGIAGIDGIQAWKRRTPDDIAILNGLAAQPARMSTMDPPGFTAAFAAPSRAPSPRADTS